MHYDWTFTRKIRCSHDDRLRCLRLISEILALAKKARSLGLLSLIEYIENCPRPFLKKGLQLIVDGEKPATVREILEIAIMSAGYRGHELLERCIILEGLMGIQSGLNPKSIKELLLSFLGEEATEEYAAYFEEIPPSEMGAILAQIGECPSGQANPCRVSGMMAALGDDEIQQFLKEISTADLAKALKSMTARAQMQVFSNLPKRGATFLRESLAGVEELPPAEVTDAKERIEAILKDIQDRRTGVGPAEQPGWTVSAKE